MVLTVYGMGLSQPARSVTMFCKIAKIPFTQKDVHLMEGEQKKDPYLAINPVGEVPAIVDGDFKLAQCMSILKYLARKYKVADHWYPEDLKVKAKVDEYLDWQHTGLRRAAVDVFWCMILTPRFTGKPIDEEKLAKDLEAFDKSLGIIENAFLGDKRYLASDKISIADICCLSEIIQITAVQRTDLLANHPKLADWKARVQEELNPTFDEVFKPMFEFGASLKK